MTSLSLFATVALASAVAQAEGAGFIQAVCTHHRELVNNMVWAQAKTVVNEVFAHADVRIEWLTSKQCRNGGGGALHLEMDSIAPAGFGPETMAFATPYDLAGISIHVFYNRVMEDHRELRGPVLGHVLAHEMGHVLEGVARHSAGGLMKAYWQTADYSQMSKKRLYFAAEDVELMHLTLLRRSESALTASAGRE